MPPSNIVAPPDSATHVVDTPAAARQTQGNAAGSSTPLRKVPLPPPHVCECPPARRNLVVCIDGTSNQFSKKNTNVVELYNRLIKDPKTQLTYYSSGIGTYARPSWKSWKYYKQIIGHKVDLAIAWRFEKILLDAYRWLSDNYEEGDRIYFFGFSRGAYQVRVLSAMIHSVGLIHKGNQNQIPFAYQLYAESEKLKEAARRTDAAKERPPILTRAKNMAEKLFRRRASPGDEPAVPSAVSTELVEAEKMLKRFKAAFSRHVRVHFVGAWDTVSSVGVVRDKNLPGTTLGMGHVCYFRHALALHERRVKFLPEYACGGLGPTPEYTVPSMATPERPSQPSQTTTRPAPARPEQAAGKTEAVEKSRPPLQRQNTRTVETDRPLVRSGESSSGAPVHTKEVWFAGSHFQIGGGVDDNLDLDKFGPALRWISFEAELVGLHLSADPNDWDINEVKVYQSLRGFWRVMELIPLKRLRYGMEGDMTTFRLHLGRPRKIQPGQLGNWQLIHETALRYVRTQSKLNNNDTSSEISSVNVNDLADSRKYMSWCALLPLGLSWDYVLLHNTAVIEEDPYTAAQSILLSIRTQEGLLQETEISGLRTLLRTGPDRRSLRDSPNADDILLAVIDTYCEEAARSRETWPALADGGAVVIQALRAVTIDLNVNKRRSPETVRRLAAAFAVRDEEKAKQLMLAIATPQIRSPLLRDSSEWFLSLSYFHDDGPLAGNVAVGGDEGTLRIWNPETGQSRQWIAHTNDIHGLAISPETHHIVTSSNDRSLRCWDAATGEAVCESFVGHTDWVRSVAISPDISHRTIVASGSDDSTIRLWDVSLGKEIGDTMEGLGDYVRSVAFSPDGKYLASGSEDYTVRLWKVDEAGGLQASGIWRGHDDYVLSVAFSPDGRYLASGSRDDTIRIWHLHGASSGPTPWPFDGSIAHVLRTHISTVNSVAFSPDSARLVSGSEDRSVIIWDVSSGDVVWGPFKGHAREVTSVWFSPDGRNVASCSTDKSARIWDAAWCQWHQGPRLVPTVLPIPTEL